MIYFAQQLVNGLSNGLAYSGLALALVIVFRGSGIINIAQGEMATLSAFLSWTATAIGVPWPLAILGVILISFLLGVVTQRVFIRPVEHASHLNVLVVTLALLVLIEALIGTIWGYLPHSVPSPFGEGAVHLGGVTVSSHQLGSAVTLVLLLLLFVGFFRYTSAGLQMRAATDNSQSARLLGVRVSRMLALSWGLAAVMGGVVGIMAAPQFGLDITILFSVSLYAFAAAVLGGLTSMVGAVIGGLIIGVAQTLSGAYIPLIGSDLNVIVPFVLILVVLLVRPSGLFGRATAGRV